MPNANGPGSATTASRYLRTRADRIQGHPRLAGNVCQSERRPDRVRAALLAYLKKEQIEQPSRMRLLRIIGSGLEQAEKTLTLRISSWIPDEAIERMLTLIARRAGDTDAGRLKWRHIAVDGKTVRGARDGDGKAPHLLAAYDVTAGTVLGQDSVDVKTNEITCLLERGDEARALIALVADPAPIPLKAAAMISAVPASARAVMS